MNKKKTANLEDISYILNKAIDGMHNAGNTESLSRAFGGIETVLLLKFMIGRFTMDTYKVEWKKHFEYFTEKTIQFRKEGK